MHYLQASNFIFHFEMLWIYYWQTTLRKLFTLLLELCFSFIPLRFKSNSPIKQFLQTPDHQSGKKCLNYLTQSLVSFPCIHNWINGDHKDSSSKLTCWFCPSIPLLFRMLRREEPQSWKIILFDNAKFCHVHWGTSVYIMANQMRAINQNEGKRMVKRQYTTSFCASPIIRQTPNCCKTNHIPSHWAFVKEE